MIKYCSGTTITNLESIRNGGAIIKKIISEQKVEIRKLKLDTQKLETVESEKRKAYKSMSYFKKQNSEYREINQNQEQVILQLQRDLSDKDRNIDNLIAQVNELIEDKISVETFSYLSSVRQVVQDLHSFGVGVKHIGQTIQTVLKHLVGIEGVKVPSEPSNKRMILESNFLAKVQIREKILSHGFFKRHKLRFSPKKYMFWKLVNSFKMMK